MTEKALRAIEAARWNRAHAVVYNTDDVIDELATEVDRLAFALHQRRAHPDFEYATTQTARKSGDDPRVGLEGDGWEPNDVVACHEYEHTPLGKIVREHWRNWERFEFHENNYWRRRKA